MDDTENIPRHTKQERNPWRYALVAVPVVVLGLGAWYLTNVFVVAPTIDGPSADQVQGLATTTVDELSIGGEEVAPNDEEEVAE